jgi:dTDP-4-amino-4,6-dideoxygalactose transaminase
MKLGIITGKPAFSKPLHVGEPVVEKEVRERYFRFMADVFDNRYFTNYGPLVQKLEAEVAKMHGVDHCIAVCNATIAEMLVLSALGLKGEIILPSFTFIATAHACLWQGAKTVFCDISPDTLMIDATQAEKLITDETRAIIGVHLFGNICDIQGLSRLCEKYDLRLIFDAAHAFNCSWGEKPIGIFGDAAVLSFHATKFFGTFEGGAVLTNDGQLASRLRLLVNFGFRGYDDVGFLGINGKMSEASAAMGLASLPAVESREKKLSSNHRIYCDQLSSIPGISIMPIGKNGRSNYQYAIIFVDEERFGVSRDTLCTVLWKDNIIARRYFYPGCHRMEPYKTLYPSACGRLPVTEDVSKRILCLPTNMENPEEDITKIAQIIGTVHDNAKEVSQWLSSHR